MTDNLTHANSVEEDHLNCKNPKFDVTRRVHDLLSWMTLKEKVAHMICIWGQKKKILFDENGELSLKNRPGIPVEGRQKF